MANEDEPELRWNDLDAIILILMRIEAKLDELLKEEDGEEEDDT